MQVDDKEDVIPTPDDGDDFDPINIVNETTLELNLPRSPSRRRRKEETTKAFIDIFPTSAQANQALTCRVNDCPTDASARITPN